MSVPLHIAALEVWPIRLPFKRSFGHAAQQRDETVAVVVRARSGRGQNGWGETLPRPYVTGESPDSVLAALRDLAAPALALRAESFAAAAEAIEALPFRDGAGRRCPAARAAVELALLDLATQHFAVRWSTLGEVLGLRPPPVPRLVRMSAVLGAGEPAKVLRQMTLLWLYGLRDFKLKVGLETDAAVLAAIERRFGGAIRAGRVTLRADANGAWSLEQAVEHVAALARAGLVSIEEPLAAVPGQPATLDERWTALTARRLLPTLADESLVSLDDGRALVAGAADAMNIRVSKNGGLIPALRLAELASGAGRWVQLGCMVGETSVLTAAGRVFLGLWPAVRFAEGSYGQWLLRHDLTPRPLRMGWGGRWRPVPGPGWGVAVDEGLVQRLTCGEPVRVGN